MINIRETRARRDTLNPFNIMSHMTVKVLIEPDEMRLVSLTPSEFKEIPWLHYLKTSNMAYFEVPKKVKSNQTPKTDLKCEDDYTEIEMKSPDSKTPQYFIEFMTNPDSQSDYVSLPIYNNLAFKKITQLSSRFTETPYPMRFLHINSVDFDITGLSSTVVMHFFIYQKKPITEIISMNFTSSDVHFSRYKYFNQKQELILPFPESEDSLFVCILYMPFPDSETGGTVLTPIVIGHAPINQNPDSKKKRNCKLQGVLSPTFTQFDSTIPLEEHFSKPSDKPYKINFSYSIHVKIENLEATQPIISRLTSFRNMIPTPLLTFYDISVSLKLKPHSKKAGQRQAYVRITLKMPNDNGKLAEVKLFAGPGQLELTESGCTSRITPKGDKVFYPDHLNFIISPEIDQPITAQIDIIITHLQNTKTAASTTIVIDRSFQSFVDHKMDSKGNLISFNYLYPFDFAPPKLIRDVLVQPWNAKEDISKDQIYGEIAPFALNTYLQPDKLSLFDFPKFFSLFPTPENIGIQTWIEHYFNSNNEFYSMYIEKLTNSINVILPSPFPFFLILFKTLAIIKKFDEASLDNLLSKCVEPSNLTNVQGNSIREAIADFLLRLRAVFVPKSVFTVAFKYLFKLNNYARIHVYSILFSDIAVIQSITFNFRVNVNTNQSPYIPLISLFYSTIYKVFIGSKKEEIILSVSALSILASSLEGFCDNDTSNEVAHILFPILPMIFTFYDSLISQLDDGGPQLMLIVLYILKYCDSEQFLNYFRELYIDSQLRFLDFLCTITEEDIIHGITKNAPPDSVSELDITHEVTYRILIFLAFFEKLEKADERILHSIFNLILQMLKSKKQASNSYELLFKTLSFFIKRYPEKIFQEKTTLLSQLLSAAVELTQRKCCDARLSAIGFIIWIIELESKEDPATPRCAILLQSVTCEVYLQNKNFLPFFEHLPESVAFDQVKKLHEMLRNAMEEPLHDNKVAAFLQIAHNDYKNFPSVRARILSQIVELNRANGDITSAFITQWKLCGFIAEVFKLKEQVVDGIPEEGIKKFPFIFDEPPIDLSIHPKQCKYLVIDSEMFTEDYICKAMQEAIALCKQASFNQLISKVTVYLFDNLEKRREFVLLNQLYGIVGQSYNTLNTSEDPQVEFTRVFLSEPLASKFKFSEAIRISQIKKVNLKIVSKDMSLPIFSANNLIEAEPEIDDIEQYKNLLIKEGGVESKSYIPLDAQQSKENEFQLLKVHYSQSEINKMCGLTFTKNIIGENENEIGWDEILVKRIVYVTEYSLPHPVTFSKIKATNVHQITKHDYYLEKLQKFIQSFHQLCDDLSSVIPPDRFISQMWSKCPIGLNTSPLLKKIAKIIYAATDVTSKTLVYELVLRLNVPEDKIITKNENVCEKEKEPLMDKEKSKSKSKEKKDKKSKDKKEKDKKVDKDQETVKKLDKNTDNRKPRVTLVDVPQDIKRLAVDVWKMLRDSILFVDKLFDLTKPSDEDKKILAQAREILNVPKMVLKVYPQ